MISRVASCCARHWKVGAAIALAVALPSLTAGLVGCSQDACDQANNLISDCAAPDVNVPSLSQASMSLACTETLLCQSQCINQASCLEIEELQCFNAVSCAPISCQSVASPLARCIQACSGDAGVTCTDAGGD